MIERDMMAPTIFVMMASHNRRETTVRCLSSLTTQTGSGSDFTLRVSLVDSGSSDGTLDEVRRLFPEVITASASSEVFWGTGMRLASQLAGDRTSTYHLWLNDDVTLKSDALGALLAVAADAGTAAAEGRLIVVGQLSDEAGLPTYGGIRIARRPLRLRPVGLVDRVSPCDTMNGNVVLVATPLHQRLGSIDPAFPHGLGDVDFGLRASSLGATVLQAPGFVGICGRHEPSRRSPNPLRRLRERASIKQLPVRPWLTFCRRHSGVLYPLVFVKPYLLALLGRPGLANRPDQTRRVAQVLDEIRPSGAEVMLLNAVKTDPDLVGTVTATPSRRELLEVHTERAAFWTSRRLRRHSAERRRHLLQRLYREQKCT